MSDPRDSLLAISHDVPRDEQGLYAGFFSPNTLDLSELAGVVKVDLSDLINGRAALSPDPLFSRKGKTVYLYSQAEQDMLEGIVGRQLEVAPEHTLLALRRNLGEAGADRLLQKLSLVEVEPEADAEQDTLA
jgi:hypothetical protein